MGGHCNYDTVPRDQCTLATCCLRRSFFTYRPNLIANILFVVVFLGFIIPQIWLGCYGRTRGFTIGMFIGLCLEVLGYLGRVKLHYDPWSNNGFTIYFICLTVAPVFITAALYLTLSRIIVLYGRHLSYFKARTVAIFFMLVDIVCLVVQALGAGIADAHKSDANKAKTGIDVMKAGLVLQAASLLLFLLYAFYFYIRCRIGILDMDPKKVECRARGAFFFFFIAFVIAVLAVLVRSIYRVIELKEGFTGHLWNSEVDFMVLDGLMMIIAISCMTTCHPGVIFQRQWALYKPSESTIIAPDVGMSQQVFKNHFYVPEQQQGATHIVPIPAERT